MSSMPNNTPDDVSKTRLPGSEAPTVAAFSSTSPNSSPTLARQRATILVHQKSPLLIATPPQVTRALAYSHAFLLPLNRLVGLLSWTTGDPWESFLLIITLWSVVLYGDIVLRWAGPLVLASALIIGMYARRYSPLSSTSWTKVAARPGQSSKEPDGKVRHHKSLDEIVETLRVFTTRCNILLDPLVRLTDFISTAQSATSATTRPALTSLFLRLLLLTPVWYFLTLPPLRVITTQRVVLAAGTLALSWHSRPAVVSRTILWRSRSVRKLCSKLTGLELSSDSVDSQFVAAKSQPSRTSTHQLSPSAISSALAEQRPDGVRFTFTLFENQRRWLGIGWTGSMLAYERAAWTDEQLNPAPAKELFNLPEVEGGVARWEWCEGSNWELDPSVDQGEARDSDKRKPQRPGADDKSKASRPSEEGWIYYDNKWRDPRREDGWGRYTRRRKWCRDAELVEARESATPGEGEKAPASIDSDTVSPREKDNGQSNANATALEGGVADVDSLSIASSSPGKASKGGWFRRRPRTRSNATEGSAADQASETFSVALDRDREENDYDVGRSYETSRSVRDAGWVGEDMHMELG